MDCVRALAIMWRAALDPDGSALFATEDHPLADLMQIHGFGYVEKRRPRPHQLAFFEMNDVPHEDQWITYFVLNAAGHARWLRVLDVVKEPVHATDHRYGSDGKLLGMS